jgi:hypothetical protein
MSHRKNDNGQFGMPRDEEAWKNVSTSSEWEADTHVMPPEYSRQLLEISRQLKQPR